MTRKLRLGFAGVGWIGRNRMAALIDSGRVEACGIVDPDETCVAEARQLAPDALVCATFEELLVLDLDGVVIATPSAGHALQSLDALERGLPVFCQKPLGRDGDEVAAVVAAARAADRLLGVDLSYRHLAGMNDVRAMLTLGELGRVYAVEAVFHNAYGPGKPWFYDRTQSGGGCVVDLGIHLVDLALWLLGHPSVLGVDSRCFVKGRPLKSVPDAVEDFASARIDLEGGTVLDVTCSWNLPIGADADIGLRIFGTNGGIGLRNVEGSFYDFMLERYDGRQRTTLASPPDAWGGRAALAWAEALQVSPRYDDEADWLVDLARVLDRFYA
ncbi:Gfo/Idh/MocA family oxidoreductase [Luteibacter sp. 3190]|uniref:Gfo/Idh/MocA family protein n=1 Tax=Luteibacter sp. 3190 TaxID=2817736 RepID=UPI002860D821|nr:Gfo/Idh/MocA family oxidoreductase [Luteibacter sp. 3190]MDR6935606.1 putative dehydrogenase [Luteibacter sp. 3190]